MMQIFAKKKNTATGSVELKETSDLNEHILNIITPSGIDYDSTHANIGENVGKIYCISRYPAENIKYGWLAALCQLEGTITSIEFRRTDADNLIDVYNKRIAQLKGDRTTAKVESDKQLIDKAIKDLEGLIQKIAVQKEPVGYVNIMLYIRHTDGRMLEDRIKRVSGAVAVAQCKLLNLKYKQLQAMKCMAPYGIPSQQVARMGERNMPISTFLGGFPMANAGINDPGGYWLGRTSRTNRVVILNQWIRSNDRVNSNWFISGLPGSGKSTAIKKIQTCEYSFGTKIITLDPEEEYVDLAAHPDINGDVIDCAGGSTGRINPLQVKYSPRITEDDLNDGENLNDYMVYDEEMGISDLALHIQNLRVFFKLYFGAESFDAGIKTALEECIIEVYRDFHITWDTEIAFLQPEDYPVIRDLYNKVEEKSKKPDLSQYKQSVYDRLKDLLYSIAYGADQFIWNGPTTINPQSDFIVLNCSKLLELDENVKRAQFFNLTSWAWHEMSKDRSQKVIFGIDEGYLCVDPDYPDLMKFVRNVSKRDRKYEAGLMFITHSAVDVLDPAVKRFGQAIIDNSCYRFIMGTDGKNLQETVDLFNLTEGEQTILASKSRGVGILFAGSVRLDMRLEVSNEMLEMFGKRGGR
jgi:hypothetical protein